MAKVKYGEMIADMRGKINGTVHSKNRYAQIMRNKTSPVNPQTTYQSGVRASFASFTQGWRGLTADQRNAWIAAVDDFRRTNVFGSGYRQTGANLYIGLNQNIDTIGGVAITSPPIPAAVTAETITAIAASAGGGTIAVTYAPAIPATHTVAVFATAPQSAGVNFVKNKYRFIEAIVAADISPYNIAAAYEAKFGTGWKVVGQKLFVRFVPIITLSGIAGPGFDFSTLVVA